MDIAELFHEAFHGGGMLPAIVIYWVRVELNELDVGKPRNETTINLNKNRGNADKISEVNNFRSYMCWGVSVYAKRKRQFSYS